MSLRPRRSLRVAGKPAPKPSDLPTLAENNLTYDIDTVPRALLSKQIQRCDLEFLNYGPLSLTEEELGDEELEEKKKNHVVLKVEFRREITQATPEAPAGTKGVRISLDIFADATRTNTEMSSKLKIKTLDYSGPTHSALHVFPMNMGPNVQTVRQLLKPALENYMLNFRFIHNGRGYMGCRDFMGQYIYQMERAGVIGPSLGAESAYQALCHRYGTDGNRVAKAITPGRFLNYQRVNVPGLVYE